MAQAMVEGRLSGWEAVFAAADGDKHRGLLHPCGDGLLSRKPLSPVDKQRFVSDEFRGNRLRGRRVAAAGDCARAIGFGYAYIPSDKKRFYEAYGYEKIDALVNYGAYVDDILRKKAVI